MSTLNDVKPLKRSSTHRKQHVQRDVSGSGAGSGLVGGAGGVRGSRSGFGGTVAGGGGINGSTTNAVANSANADVSLVFPFDVRFIGKGKVRLRSLRFRTISPNDKIGSNESETSNEIFRPQESGEEFVAPLRINDFLLLQNVIEIPWSYNLYVLINAANETFNVNFVTLLVTDVLHTQRIVDTENTMYSKNADYPSNRSSALSSDDATIKLNYVLRDVAVSATSLYDFMNELNNAYRFEPTHSSMLFSKSSPESTNRRYPHRRTAADDDRRDSGDRLDHKDDNYDKTATGANYNGYNNDYSDYQ
ncbi:hypothetical protein KPH14_013098, partial [Odynerus spinipes]